MNLNRHQTLIAVLVLILLAGMFAYGLGCPFLFWIALITATSAMIFTLVKA